MTNNKRIPNADDVLDELRHQAALDESEHGENTAADKLASKRIATTVEARLAELRRNLTPTDEPTKQGKPIRPGTLAMMRDALIEAINAIIESMGGAVQVAHRNLKGLSDDDLRRLYDTLDPTNREE